MSTIWRTEDGSPIYPVIPGYTCPICGKSDQSCEQFKDIGPFFRDQGLVVAPGKSLIFYAGGNRQHWAHPEHYGFLGTSEEDMVRRLAEFFDYPGGAAALDARWEQTPGAPKG